MYEGDEVTEVCAAELIDDMWYCRRVSTVQNSPRGTLEQYCPYYWPRIFCDVVNYVQGAINPGH